MTTVYKHTSCTHATIETTYNNSGFAGRIYKLKLETTKQYTQLREVWCISTYKAETKKHSPKERFNLTAFNDLLVFSK